MKYLWTEDTGAGLHFWQLVNELFFNGELKVESTEDDKYYIAFDYVVDNQDIRNKYRFLKSVASKSDKHIVILDIICFEYLILYCDKLIEWTGTGKKDKIKIREEILKVIQNHSRVVMRRCGC